MRWACPSSRLRACGILMRSRRSPTSHRTAAPWSPTAHSSRRPRSRSPRTDGSTSTSHCSRDGAVLHLCSTPSGQVTPRRDPRPSASTRAWTRDRSCSKRPRASVIARRVANCSSAWPGLAPRCSWRHWTHLRTAPWLRGRRLTRASRWRPASRSMTRASIGFSPPRTWMGSSAHPPRPPAPGRCARTRACVLLPSRPRTRPTSHRARSGPASARSSWAPGARRCD